MRQLARNRYGWSRAKKPTAPGDASGAAACKTLASRYISCDQNYHAFLRAQGKRLPIVHEWEYAASAGFFNPDGSTEPGFKEHVLEWYARPAFRTLPAIGRGLTNYWGVADLHGLIWEWVLERPVIPP